MKVNGQNVPVLGLLLVAGSTLLGWLGNSIMSKAHDDEFEERLTQKFIMIPKKQDGDAE